MLYRIIFWCWRNGYLQPEVIYPQLHVYLIRSFVSRLNPTFLIKPGFHQNSFQCPQESGLKQSTLCIYKVWINTLAMSYFLQIWLGWSENIRGLMIYCMFAILLNATTESVVEARCRINRWNIFCSLPGNINSTSVNDSMESRGATYNVWA